MRDAVETLRGMLFAATVGYGSTLHPPYSLTLALVVVYFGPPRW